MASGGRQPGLVISNPAGLDGRVASGSMAVYVRLRRGARDSTTDRLVRYLRRVEFYEVTTAYHRKVLARAPELPEARDLADGLIDDGWRYLELWHRGHERTVLIDTLEVVDR